MRGDLIRRTLAVIQAVAAVAAVAAAGPSEAGAEARYALVISGASGGASYAENYDRWRTALVLALRDKFRFHEENITVLADQAGPGVGLASRDNVRKAMAGLRSKVKAADQLLIVLIGHGSFDGADAKFNLVGPDLGAAEWKEMLADVPGRLTFVNTTSASFPFVESLSGKNRVIVTATDSTAQRYETVFPEAFIEALDAMASDLDKNGRLSVWEAFTAASAKVKEWYEQRGQLATERPLLDDNGDGVGKEAGAPGPDGEIAKRLHIEGEAEVESGSDPAVAELLRRRTELENQVEELKGRRDSMSAEEYDRQLEALLVELARVSREIRLKS
jgi:hypothetical protein